MLFRSFAADLARESNANGVGRYSRCILRALAETGSPTALLTVGCRYTHTAFETVHPRDLDVAAGLLRALVTAPLPERPR